MILTVTTVIVQLDWWGAVMAHAVVRALASHQCRLGSISGLCVICELSLLLVLVLVPRGSSPVSPLLKNQHFSSISAYSQTAQKPFVYTIGRQRSQTRVSQNILRCTECMRSSKRRYRPITLS